MPPHAPTPHAPLPVRPLHTYPTFTFTPRFARATFCTHLLPITPPPPPPHPATHLPSGLPGFLALLPTCPAHPRHHPPCPAPFDVLPFGVPILPLAAFTPRLPTRWPPLPLLYCPNYRPRFATPVLPLCAHFTHAFAPFAAHLYLYRARAAFCAFLPLRAHTFNTFYTLLPTAHFTPVPHFTTPPPHAYRICPLQPLPAHAHFTHTRAFYALPLPLHTPLPTLPQFFGFCLLPFATFTHLPTHHPTRTFAFLPRPTYHPPLPPRAGSFPAVPPPSFPARLPRPTHVHARTRTRRRALYRTACRTAPTPRTVYRVYRLHTIWFTPPAGLYPRTAARALCRRTFTFTCQRWRRGGARYCQHALRARTPHALTAPRALLFCICRMPRPRCRAAAACRTRAHALCCRALHLPLPHTRFLRFAAARALCGVARHGAAAAAVLVCAHAHFAAALRARARAGRFARRARARRHFCAFVFHGTAHVFGLPLPRMPHYHILPTTLPPVPFLPPMPHTRLLHTYPPHAWFAFYLYLYRHHHYLYPTTGSFSFSRTRTHTPAPLPLPFAPHARTPHGSRRVCSRTFCLWDAPRLCCRAHAHAHHARTVGCFAAPLPTFAHHHTFVGFCPFARLCLCCTPFAFAFAHLHFGLPGSFAALLPFAFSGSRCLCCLCFARAGSFAAPLPLPRMVRARARARAAHAAALLPRAPVVRAPHALLRRTPLPRSCLLLPYIACRATHLPLPTGSGCAFAYHLPGSRTRFALHFAHCLCLYPHTALYFWLPLPFYFYGATLPLPRWRRTFTLPAAHCARAHFADRTHALCLCAHFAFARAFCLLLVLPFTFAHCRAHALLPRLCRAPLPLHVAPRLPFLRAHTFGWFAFIPRYTIYFTGHFTAHFCHTPFTHPTPGLHFTPAALPRAHTARCRRLCSPFTAPRPCRACRGSRPFLPMPFAAHGSPAATFAAHLCRFCPHFLLYHLVCLCARRAAVASAPPRLCRAVPCRALPRTCRACRTRRRALYACAPASCCPVCLCLRRAAAFCMVVPRAFLYLAGAVRACRRALACRARALPRALPFRAHHHLPRSFLPAFPLPPRRLAFCPPAFVVALYFLLPPPHLPICCPLCPPPPTTRCIFLPHFAGHAIFAPCLLVLPHICYMPTPRARLPRAPPRRAPRRRARAQRALPHAVRAACLARALPLHAPRICSTFHHHRALPALCVYRLPAAVAAFCPCARFAPMARPLHMALPCIPTTPQPPRTGYVYRAFTTALAFSIYRGAGAARLEGRTLLRARTAAPRAAFAWCRTAPRTRARVARRARDMAGGGRRAAARARARRRRSICLYLLPRIHFAAMLAACTCRGLAALLRLHHDIAFTPAPPFIPPPAAPAVPSTTTHFTALPVLARTTPHGAFYHHTTQPCLLCPDTTTHAPALLPPVLPL